ncbi:uncharacterized protein LOC106052215 isoform X2 [Biomphalaria glabrata]|uniref:Uncharacterized protein LOC106052215 isoform X2 n=1 Tax=Biomphalaria glabrata TaxID=6526 RepID=A0A9W2ZGX5_BIOGL|nr:uncharacterized protein LOC106052215 isoform X2 [Biomphalaria glabrata]
MDNMTWMLTTSLACICLHIMSNGFLSEGTFVFPVSQIDRLASRGQIRESPSCNDFGCRPSFNSTSCLSENVCYESLICNGRTSLPPVEFPLNDWTLVNTSAACTMKNESRSLPTIFTNSKRELALVGNGSVVDPRPCYFQRNKTVDPVFTLVFWLVADCRNCSIIEMTSTNGQPIHVRVVNTTLLCLGQTCQSFTAYGGSLVMVSLQMIYNKIRIFTNSTEIKVNSNGSFQFEDVFVGSRDVLQPNNSFELFYVQYYSDVLTKNELLFLWSGLTDVMVEFFLCQCPPNFTDESDTDPNMCVNGNSTYPRFNRTIMFNSAKLILDSRTDRRWASSGYSNNSLILAFNSTFQIDGVTLTFSKDIPHTVQVTFSVNSTAGKPKVMTCLSNVCNLVLSNLASNSSFNDYNLRIADEIKIDLWSGSLSSNSSFILTNLTISGRCDCHGNADSCSEVNGKFVCNCKSESNTQGNDCKSCVSSYFRSPGQFSCVGKCQCNSDGVVNSSNPCDQSNGQCFCKANVEGSMCDSCKPFTYNFTSTNALGCTKCACSEIGSTSCSNITGACSCKANTNNATCSQCLENYYGIAEPTGCKACNCSSLGTLNQSLSCNQTSGQCQCKMFVEGRQCNTCKANYYRLEAVNPRGCSPCNCNPVGSDSTVCNRLTGQCPCRGGVITDLQCKPKILSLNPTYGPDIGGTLVTVQGLLLGNETSNIFVSIDDIPQTVVSVNDNRLVFNTSKNNETAITTSMVKVSWLQDSGVINSDIKFLFKQNPVIYPSNISAIQSFVSAGIPVFVYGDNLQSVMFPLLKVVDVSNPNKEAVGTCKHNPSNVICEIPNVKELFKSPQDMLQVNLVFDGVVVRNYLNMTVKPDPVFDDMGTIRFQYPFEDTITLTGQGLNSAGNVKDYSVLISVVHCAIQSVSDTSIVCKPAITPLSGETKQIIEIQIGNIRRRVGTLEYLKLHETTNFIIIICCISGGILLIILAVLLIIFCRRRRCNKKASSTFENLDSKKVSDETASPPEYTEAVTMVVTQPKQNGELVRMETVIKEPKLAFVNSQADDSFFMDEFLPKLEAGLREEVRQCFIGGGHFAVGRNVIVKGQQAMLTDGSLQNKSSGQKLTIKTLINPITAESTLPMWANLALTECLRLKRHKHMHVLSILGIGVDRERFHILYPCMSQNFLKAIVADLDKKFSARQLLSFAQQVAEGLCFLTSKEITHKDVAARNCMVDENGLVKLSDASFSWDFYPDEYVYDKQRERYLPLRWMAPESLSDGYYDMRTDVWSFATLIWELMTRGCLPFHEVSNENVKQYITSGYVLGKPDTLSDPMYELMCRCWSLENEYRPSIGDMTRGLGDIIGTEDDIYENLVSYSNSASPKHFSSDEHSLSKKMY